MKTKTARKRQALAKKIAALIAQRKGDISVASLCRELGYSKTLCRNAFSSAMEETIEQFAKRLRLENAAIAISESRLKIYQIAELIGYHSVEGLDRAFFSHFGCSPTTFQMHNPEPPPFPSGAYLCGSYQSGPVDVGVCTASGHVVTFCNNGLKLLDRIEPGTETTDYKYTYDIEDVNKYGL